MCTYLCSVLFNLVLGIFFYNPLPPVSHRLATDVCPSFDSPMRPLQSGQHLGCGTCVLTVSPALNPVVFRVPSGSSHASGWGVLLWSRELWAAGCLGACPVSVAVQLVGWYLDAVSCPCLWLSFHVCWPWRGHGASGFL